MESRHSGPDHGRVRIVVLWNTCRGVSTDEDARRVQDEATKLRDCDGISELALHQVAAAALRHPRQRDWCLELSVDGDTANAVVRRPPCSEFLADLRLLGTRPTIFVLGRQREATRATLEEVRAIARGLRPEALDDLGLASVLRQLCAEAERSGVSIRRNIASHVALELEAEVVVCRVAQEAITNALRHSGAEAIDVVLAAEEAGVILTVRDDGRGFAGAPSDGTGLRGMRERAVLAGGRLDVLAAPDRGTDVTLWLP